MKRIAILGSTGSIGKQTIDVALRHPDKLQISGLVARSNAELLREQQAQTGASMLALHDQQAAATANLPGGMNAILDIVTDPHIDLIVVAVAGVIGLEPTIASISAGKDIALASKEVLVAAGEVVMPLIQEHRIALTPIDSEHSAIFQCIQGVPKGAIQRLILTASGGPFRGKLRHELKSVTKEQALNHPTWIMGGKITVDSATLMNKALETIEAKWLFGVPMDAVDVVIHPQSIVHSFVELTDGSVLAQLGLPDMRIPIQYALLYPERIAGGLTPWRPEAGSSLTFERVDHEVFPGIELARQASLKGGTMPCVFNAANEEAANGFLAGKVSFLGIADTVADVMKEHTTLPADLPNIQHSDAWAREITKEKMTRLATT